MSDRKLPKETKRHAKLHMSTSPQMGPNNENYMPGKFKEGRIRSTKNTVSEVAKLFKRKK